MRYIVSIFLRVFFFPLATSDASVLRLRHQDADPGAVGGLDFAPGALGMDVARDPAGHLVALRTLGVGRRRPGGDHAAAGLQLPVAVAVQEGEAVRHPARPEAADAVPHLGVEQLVVLQLGAVSAVQLHALGRAGGGGALRRRRRGEGAVLRQGRGHLPSLGLLGAPAWLFLLGLDPGAPGRTPVLQFEGDLR